MEFVTVVNRTQRSLSGMWDGKTYVVQPGKSSHPIIIAEAIKRANPIMGSDNPLTGQLQYLIGIEEQSDECSPIEQSSEIELFNRQLMKNAVPIMVVPGNVGMFSVKRSDMAPLLAGGTNAESGFVKP
jgi:hypothetical protein